MKREKEIKVIFDTNIWISFLIGQQLQGLEGLISEKRIEIILTDQLLAEIKIVTSRHKFKKYFNPGKVIELLKFLELVGTTFPVKNIPNICRDPKDNFLLGLIEVSKPDYLVTGDKDLIDLNPYKTAKIISSTEFKKEIFPKRASK